jgi:hypothetical protein
MHMPADTDQHVDDEARPDPAHPGSERGADQNRSSGGPRYHGEAWTQADEEPARGSDVPAEEETEDGAFEANDEAIVDEGARGAVFGRGGKGIVERDGVRGEPSNRDRKVDKVDKLTGAR